MLKHLVTGGMADVLLGRSEGIEGFERHVVLKRIRPEHARDKRFIRMFIDEARVASNLHHQHIVQVHDVGESGGEYFIAMEYIHGEDVRTLLSTASKLRSHVPLGYAIMIASAVAAGLHYAHERRGPDKRSLSIVHRDISPSNLLVGHDGSIKIVDFGIAKATMSQETRSGTLKGKVSYMSPEQCKSDNIDRRSDVYSLGVVLYELATTTRLFRGENDYLVMDQIVNGRIALPRVRRPDLPNDLSTIIMRALATEPERRYFTAEELHVALDQFAAKAGLTASPSSLAAYMRKMFGERPEPWLELNGQVVNSLDEVQTTVAPGRTAQSWTDLPRSDDERRSDADLRRSGAIARRSGPIGDAATEPAEAAPPPHDARDDEQRIFAERSLITPSPTDSRMAWESQRRPGAGQRVVTPIRVAIVCVPLIVLLGIAVWRLAGMGAMTSPVAAVATQAASPVEVLPAPVVTPIPLPPPDPAPSAAPSPPSPRAVARLEAPAPTKRAAPPLRRNAATKATEATRSAPASAPSAMATASPPSSPSPLASPEPPSQPAAEAMPAAATPPANTGSQSTAAPANGASPTGPPQVEGPAQIAHTVVEHVASAHLHELSKCESEGMRGDVTVTFIVDGSGKVSKAQLAGAAKKYKLAACILRSVQKWQFPKQGPTGAQATYTLSFQ